MDFASDAPNRLSGKSNTARLFETVRFYIFGFVNFLLLLVQTIEVRQCLQFVNCCSENFLFV
jgi:hypothetical protein